MKALLPILAVLVLTLTNSPSYAYHCPRGQIWKIHRHVCVGKESIGEKTRRVENRVEERIAKLTKHKSAKDVQAKDVQAKDIQAKDIMNGDPIEDRVVDTPAQPVVKKESVADTIFWWFRMQPNE